MMTSLPSTLPYENLPGRELPRRTEDYHQIGYENHLTYDLLVQEAGPRQHRINTEPDKNKTKNFIKWNWLPRLYDRTPLGRVRNFHLTVTALAADDRTLNTWRIAFKLVC